LVSQQKSNDEWGDSEKITGQSNHKAKHGSPLPGKKKKTDDKILRGEKEGKARTLSQNACALAGVHAIRTEEGEDEGHQGN